MTVSLSSVSKERITFAEVRWGSGKRRDGIRTEPDMPLALGEFSIGGIYSRLPTTATLNWTTEDGQQHTQEIQVARNAPPGEKPDLDFRFDEEGQPRVIYSVIREDGHKEIFDIAETAEQKQKRLLGDQLYRAAAWGRLEEVEELLKKGVDANSRLENFKETPLGVAIRNKKRDVVERLLASKADPNTALGVAIVGKDIELLELLLKHGANLNSSQDMGPALLTAAIGLGDSSTAKWLIDHGAEVKHSPNFFGYTPLWTACSPNKPDPELIQLLLSKGADPNAGVIGFNKQPAPGFKSPLSFTMEYRSREEEPAKQKAFDEVIALLKKAGAKP